MINPPPADGSRDRFCLPLPTLQKSLTQPGKSRLTTLWAARGGGDSKFHPVADGRSLSVAVEVMAGQTRN